jgi:tetratricopeptide (TPR) repeat protein
MSADTATKTPLPRKSHRKKIDYFKWTAGIAVPIIVAIIGLYKSGSGDEKKTPGNFEYIGSVQIIENQYQQFVGQPLKDESTRAQLTAAMNLAQAGQYDASLPIFEQLAEKVPVPAIYNSIGSFYAEKGDTKNARNYFLKAIAKDPNYKPTLDNLARLTEAPKSVDARPISSREAEPNNDILHANVMPVGASIAGEISDPSDTDFFQFTSGPAPRDIYRITMTPALTLRPDIHVYDSNRNHLFEDSRPTGGAVLERDFSPAASTVYFVQVAPYDNSGAYTLSVKPLHAFDSFEPDDDIASARTIALGKTIEANIMDASDTDFYQVKSGSAPSLTVTMNPVPSLRPDIHVYDAQRNHLFEDSRPTGGAILERKFDVQPNSVYYIQIAPYDNAGKYTLTVQ